MFSRRSFVKSSLLALSPTVPGFLARTAQAASEKKDTTILVIIQLDGGNDGINTVIPFKDDGYAKHRRSLRYPKERVLKINDELGLNPGMTEVSKLMEQRELAIIQGVGYPNPSRSHFESMAIWHSARRNKDDRDSLGWLGRAFDKVKMPGAYSVHVGIGELPNALRGRRAVASGLTRPEDFVLDPDVTTKSTSGKEEATDDLADFVRRYALDAGDVAQRMEKLLNKKTNAVSYPSSQLASDLQLIARLIKADAGTRVFYARQRGYDTHSSQFGAHQQLLSALSGAMSAFWHDLTESKLSERVVVMAFSEFGRTVKENGSAGTDHGTAGPVLMMSSKLKSALVGKTPSLTDLDPKHGDLRSGIDFRQVYATVLEDWLKISAKDVLEGEHQRLDLW